MSDRHNCEVPIGVGDRHNCEVPIGGEMTSHNCDGKSGINEIIHDHEIRPIAELGPREWIRRGGYSFGSNPYDVLFEETRALTADIEIEIRVIQWKTTAVR